MAYLDFNTLQGNPVVTPADVTAAPRTYTGFSALEWQVVAIAQHDRLSSLRKPGKLATAISVVFGGQRANPELADSRLEALRRLAVHAWHRGYTVPRAAIRAFHEVGFTTEQYETLLASISRGRAALNQGNRA